jgi:hypothetical protein
MKYIKKYNSFGTSNRFNSYFGMIKEYIKATSPEIKDSTGLTTKEKDEYSLVVRDFLRKIYPTTSEYIRKYNGYITILKDPLLNFISRNNIIIKKIKTDYRINTFEELMNFIEKNKYKLFVEDINIYLDIVERTILKGKYSTEIAKRELNKMIGTHFIIRESDKSEDISGIDLIINSRKDPNLKITCQIKSTGYNSQRDGDYVKIIPADDPQKYDDIDIIIFVNYLKEEIMIFTLDDYKLENNFYCMKRHTFVENLDQFNSKV